LDEKGQSLDASLRCRVGWAAVICIGLRMHVRGVSYTFNSGAPHFDRGRRHWLSRRTSHAAQHQLTNCELAAPAHYEESTPIHENHHFPFSIRIRSSFFLFSFSLFRQTQTSSGRGLVRPPPRDRERGEKTRRQVKIRALTSIRTHIKV
jgi:hypothetical protein